MFHLLQIEWLKVKNYRTFWVIFLLYLIAIVGANYIAYEFQQMIFREEAREDPNQMIVRLMVGNPPYSFPQVWQMASQVTSYLLIIPGLLIIILATNEYSFKTHRQNIIDGFTRQQFVTSKVLTVVMIALASTIMTGIAAMIFGFLGDKDFSTSKMEYLLYSFLQCLNYCLVALLFSVLLRRSGIALGVYILYVVILENILFLLLNKYVDNSGYFLPVESADGLITAPVFEQIQSEFVKRPTHHYMLIACLVYIGLYLLVSYRKFEKDDL